MKRTFEQRECYVNCAEHLLNSQNVNIMFETETDRWTDDEWSAFFKQIKEFGFNTFNIWIPPTLVVPGEGRDKAVKSINRIVKRAHGEGLKFLAAIIVNTIGGEWYFACPNDKVDREKILEFWRYYAENLEDIDYLSIFPGDPGGCNRNDCNHVTYLELALELTNMIKSIIYGLMKMR